MNFDTFSLAAMAAELRPLLLGGRVQKISQINSLTFGFEIYVHPIRHYLLLASEPQAPRLHLTEQKVRRGASHETPLMLVLRKYLRNARLKAIEQPAYERLLHFQFEGSYGPATLVAEMMGPRSNLLLLAPDQTILGVARLSKPAASAKVQRILIPGHFYQPPPPQSKLLAPTLTELDLQRELDEASPQLSLARFLPAIIAGVSPLLAQEIVYRATGHTDTTVGQRAAVTPLLETCRVMFAHLTQDRWQPTLAVDDEGDPLAFAPYPLHHLPHTETLVTFSATVETYFADAAGGYSAAKAPLNDTIAAARQKLDRRRERLAEDAAARSNPIELKEKGEAILAYAHQLQAGQTELVVTWTPGQPPVKISLDPSLSASENAQQYFSRYRKAQRTSTEIPAQLEQITLEESYLEQLEQDLDMAENRPEIDAVAEALAEAGYRKASRKGGRKKTATQFLRLTAPGGATVWVGKNALQNAHLTFHRATPDDLWLHAKGIPGAHVLIPTAQGLPDEADVFWAASVAAYYSRARHDTSVEVDVTLKKYVRAIKGAAPGLVTYRHESTFRVPPAAPEGAEEDV